MQVSTPPILKSKKFLAAALASALSYLGVREGFDVQQIALFTAPLYAYIGGQALADVGKEKAKAEATTTATLDTGSTLMSSTTPDPQP